MLGRASEVSQQKARALWTTVEVAYVFFVITSDSTVREGSAVVCSPTASGQIGLRLIVEWEQRLSNYSAGYRPNLHFVMKPGMGDHFGGDQ
jgi:hypothetical protein